MCQGNEQEFCFLDKTHKILYFITVLWENKPVEKSFNTCCFVHLLIRVDRFKQKFYKESYNENSILLNLFVKFQQNLRRSFGTWKKTRLKAILSNTFFDSCSQNKCCEIFSFKYWTGIIFNNKTVLSLQVHSYAYVIAPISIFVSRVGVHHVAQAWPWGECHYSAMWGCFKMTRSLNFSKKIIRVKERMLLQTQSFSRTQFSSEKIRTLWNSRMIWQKNMWCIVVCQLFCKKYFLYLLIKYSKV